MAIRAPAQWRIMALFFVHALAAGAIHTRIPDVQLQIGLSEAELGMVLMGQPLGALSMFLFSSRLIEALGPRKIILWLLPVMTASAALVTVLLHPLAMFILLAINGVGFSVTNIAINVEADRVEASTGQRIMNTCHGAWSLGFLLTSLLGAALRGMHVLPAIHLWGFAPILIALLLVIVLPMPSAAERAFSVTGKRKLAWPTLATMGLVAFGLGAGLMEGASRAWSIILLRDSFDAPVWVESMALPALLVTMAIGRLLADPIIERHGPVKVARLLTSLAIAGLLMVVLSPHYLFAIGGFALIGAGICVLYPLMLSAAARLGDRPASENVAATTLIVQMLNLGAPALIGGTAENFGVRIAFAILLPLLMLTWAMSGRLAPPEGQAGPAAATR
ncbi:MFS transporter [Devosia submarina]|uniref:MFS transporter n=1 Tax=Devosia submarina TaxID=1173082 RepID=UPI0013003D05|nr:MFS transporter [Devosia submarina]